MTGDSLARRIQSAAARSQTKLPETTQRAWHDADMIKLGKGRARKDHNGSLEDTSALLTRPASLAFIFLTAFLIILAVLLWRDGRFDAIFDRLTPEVARPSATWMESRKASELKGAIQASETAPVPDFENEIEKAEKQQRSEVASPQLSGDASEE